MSDTVSVAPRDLEIAREFAAALAKHSHARVFEVLLFGSRARGDANDESDLDLFVGLKSNDPAGETKAAALQIACDLTLKYGILVSVFVADKRFLDQRREYSFVRTVEEEGVRV
jgi:predicted nucleotidyltransferase